jgi:hypothetical protein
MFKEVKIGAFNIIFIRLEGDFNIYQCMDVDGRFISTNVHKTHSFKASNGYIISSRPGFVGVSKDRIYLRNEEPVTFKASLEEFQNIVSKVGIAITELNEELEKEGAFKPDTFEGEGRCTQF